jgi:rsbT co-antagonist protein RsbR
MEHIYKVLGETLSTEAHAISETVLTHRYQKYPIKDGQLFDYEISLEFITQFITIFGESLLQSHEEAVTSLINWSKETAFFSYEHGQSLDIALQPLTFIRTEVINIIERTAIKENYSISETIAIVKEVNTLLDQTVHCFCECYLEHILQTL